MASQDRLEHDPRMKLHGEPAGSDRPRKLYGRSQRNGDAGFSHEVLYAFASHDEKSMKSVAEPTYIDPGHPKVLDGERGKAGLFEQLAAASLDR